MFMADPIGLRSGGAISERAEGDTQTGRPTAPRDRLYTLGAPKILANCRSEW